MFTISPNNIQELTELILNITNERNQYNEYKILIEVILDCTKGNSKLSSDLRTKIFSIVMGFDVEQCSDLNLKDTSLLGVNLLKQIELTYEEIESLRTSVQNGIILKSRKLFKDLNDMGIAITDRTVIETHSPFDLTTDEKVLIDFKQTLNQKQQIYVGKLQELLEIYEEIAMLRTEILPELAKKVATDSEIQSKIYCLKAEIIETKTRIDIVTEENESMEFYKYILKNIIQQQEESKSEIESLKVLKEKYKQSSCKEYHEILHSYLKYKCGLDFKKHLVNPLTLK